MVNFLKNIVTHALIVLFLIVTTGLYINFHHCDLTGNTDVMLSVPESENCCSSHHEDETCECDNEGHCEHQEHVPPGSGYDENPPNKGVYLKNFFCCSDNLFFIYIPDDFIINSSFSNLFQINEISFFPGLHQLFENAIIYKSEINYCLSPNPPPLILTGKEISYLNRQLIL